jgi:membrane associated rhomboid family serine protease
VRTLIIANVIVFLIQQTAGLEFLRLFGLSPFAVIHRFWVWQLVTYLFLHLLFNMLALWMFGSELEALWGRSEFTKYYFLTGVGAGLTTLAFSFRSPGITVGASGAIYGLLLAYGLAFPDRLIYVYFLIPIRAKILVIVFAAMEFLLSFRYTPDGIGHFAHLGGMVFGFLYLKLDWRTVHSARVLKDWWRTGRIRAEARRQEERERLRQEVDVILEKISREGMDSLTRRERETLERASRILREQ